MTVVNIDMADPSIPGVPATGALDFVPSLRFITGDQVRLPELVRVPLVAGKASPDLEPCDPGWVWRVTERVAGGSTRYVQVPAVGPVEYASLPSIDPATLLPAPAPMPGWVADLAAVTAQLAALNRIGIDTDGVPYLILGASS